MIVETQRLVLKPILESELTMLHMIFTDPYVKKYLFDGEIISLQQVEEMLKQSTNHFEERNYGLWFIRLNGETEVLGLIGLWHFFDEVQPQLLYALLPKAIKKGYATEAASKILDYCFECLGYEYLTASCDQPNFDSQKVAERIGMRKVDVKFSSGNSMVFFRVDKSVEKPLLAN